MAQTTVGKLLLSIVEQQAALTWTIEDGRSQRHVEAKVAKRFGTKVLYRLAQLEFDGPILPLTASKVMAIQDKEACLKGDSMFSHPVRFSYLDGIHLADLMNEHEQQDRRRDRTVMLTEISSHSFALFDKNLVANVQETSRKTQVLENMLRNRGIPPHEVRGR